MVTSINAAKKSSKERPEKYGLYLILTLEVIPGRNQSKNGVRVEEFIKRGLRKISCSEFKNDLKMK